MCKRFNGAGSLTDRDDLYQVGMLAVIRTAQTCEYQSDIGLDALLNIRIKGAMIDYYRQTSPFTRRTALLRRKVEDVRRKLEVTLGRSANEAELAGAFGVTQDELRRLLQRYLPVRHESFAEAVSEDHLISDTNCDPDSILEEEQRKKSALSVLEKLPTREAAVLRLHYLQELSVGEIALQLGLTSPRISQIKKNALERARRYLSAPADKEIMPRTLGTPKTAKQTTPLQ